MAKMIRSHLIRLNPQTRRRRTPINLSIAAGSFVLLALIVLFWLGRFHAR